MIAIMTGCALVFFIVIAWWGKHPVLFMLAGGFTFITGCYMPDILTQGVTNNISVSASLLMFVLALTCWAFAYNRMFNRKVS